MLTMVNYSSLINSIPTFLYVFCFYKPCNTTSPPVLDSSIHLALQTLLLPHGKQVMSCIPFKVQVTQTSCASHQVSSGGAGPPFFQAASHSQQGNSYPGLVLPYDVFFP